MTSSTAPRQRFEDEARRLLAVRSALVFVQTHEEQRLEGILAQLARSAFSKPIPLYLWSLTEGLAVAGAAALAETVSPVAALDAVLAVEHPALFFFRDLHRHYGDPKVVRRLRDVRRALRNNYKTLFLSGGELMLPPELEKEVDVLDLAVPGIEELQQLFEQARGQHRQVVVELGESLPVLLRGALGLTEDEARAAFAKLFLGRQQLGVDAIERLHAEKRQIVRKEGIVDFVPSRVDLADIGGLGNVKRWLEQRKRFFSGAPLAAGIDPPKGVLVTGISGCGKSMVVQAISAYWHLPLLRLDMNRIYSAMAGTPERTLERAIRTAETIAPCVLWIDEIETAIVGTDGESAGQATRIFSSFLTWMQEKEQLVFVAATANEIDKLPPELLRKGRFDEIFFVDLPNEKERLEILSVHLRRREIDPTGLDLMNVAKSTNNFNGAEIAQVVQGALYIALEHERTLTTQDFYVALGKSVPLATTMAERIKEIKRWADTRAVKAGG